MALFHKVYVTPFTANDLTNLEYCVLAHQQLFPTQPTETYTDLLMKIQEIADAQAFYAKGSEDDIIDDDNE